MVFWHPFIGYEKDRRSYILATNAANTANAFIGLAALFALSRMRNGVMAALAELPLPSMSELMVAGVLAACAAYVITIRLASSAQRLSGIDESRTEPGSSDLRCPASVSFSPAPLVWVC